MDGSAPSYEAWRAKLDALISSCAQGNASREWTIGQLREQCGVSEADAIHWLDAAKRRPA